MVRLIKPTRVLETGTFLGWSAAYMAQGLKENGFGHLDTVEFDKSRYVIAERRWFDFNLVLYITLHPMKVEDFKIKDNDHYQLIFLDTEPSLRFGEAVRFYPYLDEGGFMFIHDLPRNWCEGNINPDHPEFLNWPYGPVPNELKQLLREDKLRVWSFPTPRDLVGLYKPTGKDYNWKT